MNSSNSLDLERVGLLVDAVERRHVVLVEVLRDGLVGEQHELLDEPVRDVALGGDDRFDHPLVVEDDLRLLQIEVDRAAAVAALVQDLEQLAHQLEHAARASRYRAIDVRIAIGQDRVDVGVGHPRVAVDHAVVQLVADDRAACDRPPSGTTAPADRRAG